MMRFMEIANAEDQLTLSRLISDKVWSSAMSEARLDDRQKFRVATTPKPKRFKRKKAGPKSSSILKPKLSNYKRLPAKSLVHRQSQSVTPNRPTPLPSSLPVIRPTRSSSFSQANLYDIQQQVQVTEQSF